jgi:hypothetical protein
MDEDQFVKRAQALVTDVARSSLAGLQRARTGRGTITEQQINLYRQVDLGLRAAELFADVKLACGKGCSYCCHYRVMVTATEAFAIADAIQSRFDIDQRGTLIEKLKANRALTAPMTAKEHEATNIACAFLAGDGACTVYDSRPIACRKHHSADVTPCKITFDDPSVSMGSPQSPPRREIAEGVISGSMLAARDAGVDTSFYEMTAAVLEALESKSAAKRWRAGKVAFPGVRDRTSDTGIVGFDELPPVSQLG